MKPAMWKWMVPVVLVWGCLLLGGGCGESRVPFAGTYKSSEPFAGKGHIELVLRSNGEASWTLAEDGTALKFKWRVEEGRIWLYTKEGGIIIVTPTAGGKHLSADMTGEWHPGCPMDKCITFDRVKEGG